MDNEKDGMLFPVTRKFIERFSCKQKLDTCAWYS